MQPPDLNSPSPSRRGSLRHGRLLLSVALVIGVIGWIATVALRNPDDGAAGGVAPPARTGTTATPTTAVSPQTRLVARLREILTTRDRDRDVRLLETIYTSDCPCLRGDSDAIRQLLKDNAVWVGASTSIRVRQLERVNDRMWIIVGDFIGSPFRIETESGRLIRSVEGRSELFRFVLGKTAVDPEWLLGYASSVDKVG
jgi:hypothetical protein